MSFFKTGVMVGRFQPIHIGHEKLINIGLTMCEKLVVFVSSADKVCTIRNPYSAQYRIEMISKIFEKEIEEKRLILCPLNDLTNENDLTPLWGEYVLNEAKKVLNNDIECIIYGKDKNIFKCFSKEIVKDLTEIFVDRNKLEVSATEVRELLKNDNKEEWKKIVNPKIYDEYDNLRRILINIKED